MHRDVLLSNGEHLALEFTRPLASDQSLVVFLHGLGSDRSGEKARYLEHELTHQGLGFARFDFRGHGSSGGRMRELTINRCLEDLRAVLAFLGSEGRVSADRVILVGSSLGALVSAWYSALEPAGVAGQVLLAPAFRIVERMLQSIGETGRERWQELGIYHFVSPWIEFDLGYGLVTDSKRYPCDLLPKRTLLPTVIIHGSDDVTVPLALSEEFVARCGEPRPRLIVVPGGDHRLTAHKELIAEEVMDLAERLYRERRSRRSAVASSG